MIRSIILIFKRNKLKKELNARDLMNFNDIVKYIGMSTLNSMEQEIVFQQVLDMMLQAKSEGKFASEVIGYDVKGFCDSIIKESNYSKNILLICLNYIEGILQLGLIYFLMISILKLITRGGSSFKTQAVFYIDIATFIAMFAIIFPLSLMIRRKQFFKRNKNKLAYSLLFAVFGVFVVSLGCLIFSVPDIIRTNFPQLATAHIIPYENKILLLIIFLIAFGRDICYLIKSISKKFRKR